MEVIENGIRYSLNAGAAIVLGFVDGYTADTLEIPEYIQGFPVTEIANNAFRNTNIEGATLSIQIVIVNMEAFADCKNLKYVNIGEVGNMEKQLFIKYRAFSGCESLFSVDAWSRPTTIESKAFADCSNLEALDMCINSAWANAFEGCGKLKQLTFAENAFLLNGCINNCGVEAMFTFNNVTIQPEVLSEVLNRNVTIFCTQDSSLLDLAFEGYPIKVYSDDEEELLLEFLKPL